MTESCNLNCVYCYEHIKGKAIIPLEIAQEAIKSTFKRAVKEQINYVEILFPWRRTIYGISTYQSDMRMAMATSMAY